MALAVVEPAASHDLATPGAARAALSAAAGGDAALAAAIRRASDDCARWCGRPGFGRERLRQSADGAGMVVLERDLRPAIVSVSAAGIALAPEEWVLDGPVLRPCWWRWRTDWPGPLEIDYRAGFDLPGGAPPDLERACLLLLEERWSGTRAMPAGVRALLAPYRRTAA